HSKDPRKPFMKQLIKDIPDHACLVVYNARFESGILANLGRTFPEFNTPLVSFQNNMVDLMLPFKHKQLYSHKMKGSYSIKAVLPTLVPELSYDTLDISKGDSASRTYMALHKENDRDTIQKTRQQLLDYCELDTLAMVKIIEKLRRLI
ncbi:MAG: DUF2779 domain-containing protein, partial [Candidatus Margulisbacteria bacterium]|nr:DUF2779 domain-containing protein [Candidatus Margulisiibacteriota bacterium]